MGTPNWGGRTQTSCEETGGAPDARGEKWFGATNSSWNSVNKKPADLCQQVSTTFLEDVGSASVRDDDLAS
jgi:hypothetical protein